VQHDRPHPLTDAALHQEIEAALAVYPSAEFVARVRMRVASQRSVGWMIWRTTAFGWTAAAAGAVVAMLAVALLWPTDRRRAGVERDVPLLAIRLVASAQPVSVPLVAHATTLEPTLDTPWPRARAASEPPVLIAADEAAALRKFLQGVRERRVDAALLASLHEDDVADVASPRPEAIVVAPLSNVLPLVVEPLPAVAALQGAVQ